jgi:hypothetical protein
MGLAKKRQRFCQKVLVYPINKKVLPKKKKFKQDKILGLPRGRGLARK